MISHLLAKQLKEAGLIWKTTVNDFFGIPDRGLDDKVFVISDMMVTMALLQGWPALTFHGTAEWAADHLFTHEAVWLPTEEQLRDELSGASGLAAQVTLTCQPTHFVCSVSQDDVVLSFTGDTASDAYGAALLHFLQGSGAA